MSDFRKVMEPKLVASRRVEENGCWLWTGAISTHGYGITNFQRKQLRAHQAAYRVWVGEVPAGMQLDHLCRNRSCFNPDHLECVTPRENTLRGDGITARAAQATHCPAGHPYDAENTYVTPRGHRDCRTCRAEASRRAKAARKEAFHDSAQHTPGPWTVAPPNHDPDNGETLKRHWTVRAPGRTSAILSFQLALISSLGTDHEEADARLIAAAPDMLAALQELVRIRDWVALAGGAEGPLPQDVIQKFAEQQIPAIDAARAAIAKAGSAT